MSPHIVFFYMSVQSPFLIYNSSSSPLPLFKLFIFEDIESLPYRISHILNLVICILVMLMNLFLYLVVRSGGLLRFKWYRVQKNSYRYFFGKIVHGWCYLSLLHWIRRHIMSGCPTFCDVKIYQWIQVLLAWPFS